MATSTPPGWYPDPDDAAYLRWFDGTFLTDARASAAPFIFREPAPGPAPPPPGSRTDAPEADTAEPQPDPTTASGAATDTPDTDPAEPQPGPTAASTAGTTGPDPGPEPTASTADVPEPPALGAPAAPPVPGPGPLGGDGARAVPTVPAVSTAAYLSGADATTEIPDPGPVHQPDTDGRGGPVHQPDSYGRGGYRPAPPAVCAFPPSPAPTPASSGDFPPPPPAPQPPAGTPRRGGSTRRRRGLLIGGVVAAGLVAGGGFLLLRGGEADLQWQGQGITDPEATLADAETILDVLVEERHGALADDSRCYFSLPEDESVKDVNDHVRCGPVLFVDGDPDEPYLSFPLTAADEQGDPRLTVGADPVEPEPTALAAGERLERPDDATPPDGAGGLEPPDPPPAAEDHLGAVALGPTSMGTPPAGATIGSLNASYDLTGLATIDRYGVGDAARGPAEGHQLIAFTVAEGSGDAPVPSGTPTVQVQIDDGSPRDVADLIRGSNPIVVSAPDDAGSVDLVVTDAGVEQRISVLDGTPAGGNLRVLTRTNRSQQVGTTHQVTATGSDAIGSGPVNGTITVNSVHLDWFLREDPSKRATRGDSALLVVGLTYSWVEIVPPDAGLSAGAFTLALPDGQVLQAQNLAPDPTVEALIAFEVPANFTTGTLNIGGVVGQPNGVTVDFGQSVYPTAISIPAG